MVQEVEIVEVEIDGRTFWVSPVSPEVLESNNVAAETLAISFDKRLSRAVGFFGNAGMVELTCLIGYYCMIAMTLNEHGVPLPEGAEPALPPPG